MKKIAPLNLFRLTYCSVPCLIGWSDMAAVAAADPSSHSRQIAAFVSTYCVDCHNSVDAVADVDLETASFSEVKWTDPRAPRADWEAIYKKVASRQMPPADSRRPSIEQYEAATNALAAELDGVAETDPRLPPSDSLRRLTRTEYQNSIRDLLGVELDLTALLPEDESSGGFDNITVGDLSATLMNRYLNAAEQISRIAIGRPTGTPTGIHVRLPADLTQEKHVDGLPLGTRGGTNLSHPFAESGIYEIAVRLTRDRDEMIEGLDRSHDLVVLIDRELKHRWTIRPPQRNQDDTLIDANLKIRLPIAAGQREIAVTFVSQGEPLIEIKREPFDAAYNRHRHPRQQPALFEVSIVGPLTGETDRALSEPPAIDATASRRRIFIASPESSDRQEQLAAARIILGRLARLAFRRDIVDEDLTTALTFFEETIDESVQEDPSRLDDADRAWRSQFDLGIERAVASLLVNPNFLFHVEGLHDDRQQEGVTPISNFELASRMAAFLWSSLPDERLLDLATAGKLARPDILQEQTRRMLADERSSSLTEHFATQWLYLKNLDTVSPDLRLFPDFDENLRRAFRRETELVFEHVLRHDVSVLGLIDSDFTFLNERLARHYGVAGVLGDAFRRVDLPADSHRGGLLRHGSILTVTSYATRTSPTVRGNWILENIVGTPPPPPPPDVPSLKERTTMTAATFRERLALHRENSSCASCHALMDPVGFSLDHYDAVGRWRVFEGEHRVDASGTLPDGTQVRSVEDLEASLLANPDLFVSCLTEKMMTFALGRIVDYRDAAAIRKIVRSARSDGYRMSSIIQGIVSSQPFTHR